MLNGRVTAVYVWTCSKCGRDEAKAARVPVNSESAPKLIPPPGWFLDFDSNRVYCPRHEIMRRYVIRDKLPYGAAK